MAVDPVCDMKVDEKKSQFTSTYDGKIYYFCSEACKTEFEENPRNFVKK